MASDANVTKYDIMISYEWQTGTKYALKLNSLFEENGYKVWFDHREMSGDMNDRMAERVSDSNVIVCLISDSYEKSHNCKKEYSYADKLRKKIIPVKVEKYNPTQGSALDLLIGTKIYYPLYDDYDRESVKLLADVKKQLSEDEVDGSSSFEKSSHSPLEIVKKIVGGCIFKIPLDKEIETLEVQHKKSSDKEWSDLKKEMQRNGESTYVKVTDLEPKQYYDFKINVCDKEGKTRTFERKEFKIAEEKDLNYWRDCDTKKCSLTIICDVSFISWEPLEVIKNLKIKESEEIQFSVCGGTTLERSLSQWKEKGEKLYDNFYGDNRVIASVNYTESTKLSDIASMFLDWCQNAGLVATYYELIDHCTFLNKEFIQQNKQYEPSKTYDNLITIYNSKEKAFLLVRVLEGKECKGTIGKELFKTCNNVISLIATNYATLTKKNIAFFGLVCTPDISEEELKDYSKNDFLLSSHTLELVVCKEYLKNANSFKVWWEKLSKHLTYVRSDKCERKEDEKLNRSICSGIIAHQSTVKIHMPRLDDCEQLTSIVLNNEQRNVMQATEKKLCITGPYGSGKSILGTLLAEKQANKKDDGKELYFVICDPISTLDLVVKKQLEETKVNVVNIGSLSISDSLKNFTKSNPNKTIDVVFDEISVERMTEYEVYAINTLLSNHFENSFICFLFHSMEKYRWGDEDVSKERFDFKRLNMKHIELSVTQRNTKSINDLVIIAQNVIKDDINVFRYDKKADSIQPENPTNQGENPTNEVENPTYQGENPESPIENPPNRVENPGNPVENPEEKTKIPVSVQPELEEYQKYLATETGNASLATKYVFTAIKGVGHNIQGEKPLVGYIPIMKDRLDKLTTLGVILKDLITDTKKNGKTLVIPFDGNLWELTEDSFNLFDIDFASYRVFAENKNIVYESDKREALHKFDRTDILITTIRGCRGYEADNVFLLIDAENINTHRMISEPLTRGTNKAVIILFNFPTSLLDKDVSTKTLLYRIVNAWKKKNVIKTQQYKLCKNENCRKHNSPMCDATICNCFISNQKLDKYAEMKKKCEETLNRAESTVHFEKCRTGLERCHKRDINNLGEAGIAEIDFYIKQNHEAGFKYLFDLTKYNKFEILSNLLNRNNGLVHMRDENNSTLLFYAALLNKIGIVKLLLRHNVDVGATNIDGFTAIHYAVHLDNAAVLEVICEHDSSHVGVKNKRNYTALMDAERKGSTKCVEILKRYS